MMCASLFIVPFTTLLPVFARDLLGVGATGALVEAYSWSAGVLLAVAVAALGAGVLFARRETIARPVTVPS